MNRKARALLANTIVFIVVSIWLVVDFISRLRLNLEHPPYTFQAAFTAENIVDTVPKYIGYWLLALGVWLVMLYRSRKH